MSEEQTEGFSKILVGIDGSEASIYASRYAIDIAKKYNSQLIALFVLHVHGVRSISSTFITAPTSRIELFEKEKKEAQELLDKVRIEAQREDVELRTEIVEGSASVEGSIVDFAENEGASLIVVGTRGKSGFKRLLLGSVASGVITYAHCPVMVVK
ncbi:universal stress protein [Nitrososphaera sp. AFS]|uniref:universal stress protein n=1 Tax=Nitrososphaera sp. AFS TaxID=2301191 RepID=UPI0013923DAD|nr:universal stress protein [Nitrososphaera sp. AFS]NAL78674.1 universal stress protein [Nitrososphaera sp. AFS]